MQPPWRTGTQLFSVERMKKKEFFIPFVGLKLGKHKFEYPIDIMFFESFGYNEFNAADIHIEAILNKMTTMMELDIKADGFVNVNCDLTNEPYEQELSSELHLVIKFGEAYNDEDDEILILPHGEHQFNCAQYIYEMLVLAVPSKLIHPGVLDGTLKSQALEKLQELQPRETTKEDDDTDPRWDGLKKLLTDNK